MATLNKYPYHDYNDLNLDWLIKTVKETVAEWSSYHTTWEDWKNDTTAAFQALETYVHDYFDNLDLTAEVTAIIDAMINDGTMEQIIYAALADYTAQVSELSARLDLIESGATSVDPDAELVDIRVAYDAQTYASAGAAVRAQTGGNAAMITRHSGILTQGAEFIDSQDNLYPGAADWSGAWTNSDTTHLQISNTLIYGFPAMHSTEVWRRFYKSIAVTAGKTYTFSALLFMPAGGTARIEVIHDYTTSPATVSPSGRNVSIPAGEWTVLSITFTCTASGNVTPDVVGTNGVYYFARYILTEGEEQKRISAEVLDDLSKKTTAIGDYAKYDLVMDGPVGAYWNPEIVRQIAAGTRVKIVFGSYSGSLLQYMRVDGKKTDNTYNTQLVMFRDPVRGDTGIFTAAEDYTALRIQFSRSAAENGVSATVYMSTSDELGIAYDLLYMDAPITLTCRKDGTGDFNRLVDAVQAAGSHKNTTLLIGPGEWDIVSELGSSYMESVSSSQRGLYLRNGVHVICSSRALITAKYTGSTANTVQWFSAFNAGPGGFTLENARIETDNIRYAIHDERDSDSDTYTNHYINCNIKHTNGYYRQCIGGGLGLDGHIIIDGCIFKGDTVSAGTALVSYHNSGDGYWESEPSQGAQSFIDIYGCYFDDYGTTEMINFGQSEKYTDALIHDNSMGAAPKYSTSEHAAGTYITMRAWNNVVR